MFRLLVILSLFMPGASVLADPPAFVVKYQDFVFKIKTKDGNIVGNVSIHARDQFEAQGKLFVRYPGCTILRLTIKD